jgi:hypothetical protein
MRLLVTADLHYNHGKSRPVADELIDRMNAAGGDGVLVVGDTATSEGDALERCLSRFTSNGPKLFVAGNHELWTTGSDSRALLADDLPRRVRAVGWHWLQGDPVRLGDTAIVGNIGWYDYSMAAPALSIPHRFYRRKISPGAAVRDPSLAELFADSSDIPPAARLLIARWNDGRYVKLGGLSDEQFLDEMLTILERDLIAVASAKSVITAVHHLPFRQLLPPSHASQWDFAKAYLGSEKIGELLLKYPNVTHVFCGHSHFLAKATIGNIRAVNIGSGYGSKTFETIDVG